MTARFLAAVALTLAACARAEVESPSPLSLADSVDHVDALAREPMVVQHPGGALFVSGYGDPMPHVWTSTDRGATWRAVDVGRADQGAAGNSDVDLAVAPDGTLYFVTMTFDRTRLVGTGIQVAVSRDRGTTWRWTRLSSREFDDRPWVEVAPDGTAHVIWNDGDGVAHVVSTDGGGTWVPRGRIVERGGSSHLAVGPRGEVAVRVVPLSASGNRFDAGVESIAVSVDRGDTWARHAPPGTRAWFPMRDTTVSPPRWSMPAQPRWVEPLAWDEASALYSFWADGRALWLARSTDAGASWTEWKVTESDAMPHFPYLVARGRGELAASWFSGAGDSLRAHVARLDVGDGTAPPRMSLAAAFRVEAWGQPDPNAPPHRDTAGEYLALSFLDDGSLALVAPLQHAAANRMGFSWRRYR